MRARARGCQLRYHGKRSNELLRVRMFGILEQLGGSAALDNFALVHDCNAMRDGRDRQQVVRDVQNADAELRAEAGEQLQNFRLSNQVEGAGGLICDKQWRPMQYSHRNQHPLRLTYT